MKTLALHLICAFIQAFVALFAQAIHRPLLAWWCTAWAVYSIMWAAYLMGKEK